jgi:hypothetical protein
MLIWWDILLRPTLDALDQEKIVVADARDLILDILVYEDEDENGEAAQLSSTFLEKVLDVYLQKTALPKTTENHDNDSRPARFTIAHLEALLVAFGKKKPKVRPPKKKCLN